MYFVFMSHSFNTQPKILHQRFNLTNPTSTPGGTGVFASLKFRRAQHEQTADNCEKEVDWHELLLCAVAGFQTPFSNAIDKQTIHWSVRGIHWQPPADVQAEKWTSHYQESRSGETNPASAELQWPAPSATMYAS